MTEAEQNELKLLESKAQFSVTVGDAKRMDELRALATSTCSAVDADLVLQWIDDLRGTFDGWPYDCGGGSSGYDIALTHLEGKLREHQQQNSQDQGS